MMPSRHWYAIDQGRMYLNIESPEVGGRLRRESSRLEWGVKWNRASPNRGGRVRVVCFKSAQCVPNMYAKSKSLSVR
jgi:hypothetical protein